MKRALILLMALVMLSGCIRGGRYYRKSKPGETIFNADLTIAVQLPDDDKWTIFRDSTIVKKESIRKPYLYNPSHPQTKDLLSKISISKNVSNSSIDVTIYDNAVDHNQFVPLLDKKISDALETSLQKPPSEWRIKNDKETGVTYRKRWVDYIQGMKCSSVAFSRSVGGEWLPGGVTKDYQTSCAYYDLEGNQRKLLLHSHYFYHPGSAATFVENGQKRKVRMTQEMVENGYKFSMAQLYDSLQIQSFNALMMKEKGLLHDRKYEIPEW
jgi:hypothetical protein